MSQPFCPFPRDFLWGVATSSYQVEGAVNEGGRGESVWDTFCRRPGAVLDGQSGDMACDHYHRFRDDVALMKRIGVKAYRFSIAWPRIVPDDSGKPNPKGIDFYSRLVDELLAAGIQPWPTLFHWDLPQWAEDRFRGWESRDCAAAFADYAAIVGRALGDRVAGVFTINEFMCFLDAAYRPGPQPMAPGKIVSRQVLNQARHHAVLAHGLAVQALRASCARPTPVGLAENVMGVVPILETPEHLAAAREALREISGMFLTPIFEGRYHPAYLEDQGADAPVFSEEDLRTISAPLDFLGLNLYFPWHVRADPAAPRGWSHVPCDAHYPRMDMPWLAIGPQVLYWTPRLASEVWQPKAIYITENGCANPDQVDSRGEVNDLARVMYLREHLAHAHRATADGVPLKGYFLWSLLDNFEWAYGYSKRFGLVHVNFQTLHRTPKLSAKFYADVIRRNALGGE
jgi:beta-glucosidase